MSKYFLDVLILTTLYLSWFNGLGFGFNIDISPNKVSGLVHNDVTIHCSMDKSDADVKEILLLELSKGDDRIAILRQQTKLSVSQDLQAKFQAVGNISDPALDSYIHVTLTNPEVEDSGSYTCMVYFLDQLAVLQETRKTANLSVSDQDLKSVLSYLVQKVSSLETALNDQKSDHVLKTDHNASIGKLQRQLEEELDQQRNDHRTEVNQLQKQLDQQKNESMSREIELEGYIKVLEKQQEQQEQSLKRLNDNDQTITETVFQLQNKTGIQSQRIDDVIARENTTVLFVATHTTNSAVQTGQDMVYSDVIENIGDGYDGSTGVFTAPVGGFYLLSVSMTPYAGYQIRMDLKSSRNGILSRIYAYDKESVDYEDTTCVSRLEAGERVWPYVRSAYGGTTLWGEDTQDRLNKFNGYLIKMT